MYVNKCIKCGREFDTKNPKRVICPECLYADKDMTPIEPAPERGYSFGEERPRQQQRPPNQGGYNRGGYNRPQGGGGYNRDNRQGGYNNNRPGGGYNRDNRQGGGGYNRDNRQGGYNNNRPQGSGYDGNRPQGYRPQSGGRPGGGYNNRGGGRPGGFQNRRPQGPKQLLISREQLEQIEILYKAMLPLPNPDAHEVIGEKIGLEPRKVFFGINLIRQKLMLPKLQFPKRKLAISPDQLFAIKNLYEPLLPLPPIGCHKIIAAQLKMDEWRVHVGIRLVRSQLGLQRWNQEREDAPAEFKGVNGGAASASKEEKPKKTTRKKKTDE
jgi:hypothetical protein